jgi:hypothetical protein
MVESKQDEEQSSRATALVRAFLERHGVLKHQQIGLIVKLLGLKYHGAHRRFSMGGPWSIEELELIAIHFGESLVQLIEPDQQPAILVTGGLRTPCRIKLGDPLDPQKSASRIAAPLVAVRRETEWVVTTLTEAPNAPSHEVTSIWMDIKKSTCKLIALVTEDVGSLRSLDDYLKQHGFETEIFTKQEYLLKALPNKKWDGFVLNKRVDGKSINSVIEKIRKSQATSPVIILFENHQEIEDSNLSELIINHRLQFHIKPFSLAIVAAQLNFSLVSN